MANTSSINQNQLEQDIIKYHKKRQKAYKLITKEYPQNYQEIADKHINPRTGKPLTRGYIMIVKRKLINQGKIKDISENLGI